MAILSALAVFVFAVLLHGLVMRAPMQIDSVRRFLMVGTPLGLALVAFALSRFGFTLHGFAAILLYALLCELYMFCFTLVLSSVSATMLIMLRTGPVATLVLASVYDPGEMVQLRLNRLLNNGFIDRVKGRLSVTAQGMKYHKAFTALRAFFGHEPG
jgi:hypothetical protein